MLNQTQCRPPAVAGIFYPDDSEVLKKTLHSLANNNKLAAAPMTLDSRRPKALIVPHAGYPYSGEAAMTAYASLKPFAKDIHHVVIIGTNHHVYSEKLTLPSHDSFATPLGVIPVNTQARSLLLSTQYATLNDEAHRREHSIEVQLPMLQHILESFSITPILSIASCDETAEALNHFLNSPETVIVISSDLSHFLSYSAAKTLDEATNTAIISLSDKALKHEQACGNCGINALIQVARKNHYTLTNLALCNSGDVTGDLTNVVGYGSWRMD